MNSHNTIATEASYKIGFGFCQTIELVGLQYGNGQEVMGAKILMRRPRRASMLVERSSFQRMHQQIWERLDPNVTWFCSIDGRETYILFSFTVNGPIRSTQKFLKSVRKKLNGICPISSMEIESGMFRKEQDKEEDRIAEEMAYGR